MVDSLQDPSPLLVSWRGFRSSWPALRAWPASQTVALARLASPRRPSPPNCSAPTANNQPARHVFSRRLVSLGEAASRKVSSPGLSPVWAGSARAALVASKDQVRPPQTGKFKSNFSQTTSDDNNSARVAPEEPDEPRRASPILANCRQSHGRKNIILVIIITSAGVRSYLLAVSFVRLSWRANCRGRRRRRRPRRRPWRPQHDGHRDT